MWFHLWAVLIPIRVKCVEIDVNIISFRKRLTQFFPCKQGVRQGDPLSPILFNIFINDIFKKLKDAQCDPVTLNGEDHINALAYADDIVLLSTSSEGLQKALDTIQLYCTKWGLKINNTKTKTIIFSRGNKRISKTFSLNGDELENAKEYKYLGILIHKKNCSFSPAIKYLKNKATRAVYALRSKININQLPIPLALKLFDALIKPIILYASEVWEPFIKNEAEQWDQNDIEKIHTQFLKQILGVNRSTTTAMVRGELNRHSLQEEILRRNITYARYIYDKDEKYIIKQSYNYELTRGNDKTTFFSTIDKHAANIAALEPIGDPYTNIYNMEQKDIRTKTYNIFHDQWKQKLETSTKSDTFRSFKETMKFESYLLHRNRKERVALTKLRISDHKLMIEEGRRTRPIIPREQRKCLVCNNKVENETHFLTECKLYGSHQKFWQEVRDRYPQTANLTNQEKFTFIMTQEDPETTELLIKTNYRWQAFRTFMYDTFYQPKE